MGAMRTIAKLTVSPSWTHENKVTVRIVEKNDNYQLVCRKISQMVRRRYDPFADTSIRKKNYRQWKMKLKKTDFKNLFSIIDNAMVPAVPDYADGADGTEYMLELFIHGHSLKYSWWSVPPNGYEAIALFAGQLLDYSKHEEQQEIWE